MAALLDVDSAAVLMNNLENGDDSDNESEIVQVEMTFDMLRVKFSG